MVDGPVNDAPTAWSARRIDSTAAEEEE